MAHRLDRKWFLILLLGFITACCQSSFAQDDEDEGSGDDETKKPLVERRPFDRIYLDKTNKDEILQVEELKIKGSYNPSSYPPNEYLIFRYLWDGLNWYKVPWKNVVKIETYPEILLKEIRKLLDDKSPANREKNLALTFKYLDRVLANPNYRSNSRVQEYLREYLYEDAFFSYQNGKLREAWSALDELFILARDFRPTAEQPTVVQMLANLIDKRMGAMVKSRDYRAAEVLMDSIRAKYGATQESVINKWTQQIIADANVEKQKAIQYFRAKDARRVHDAVRNMLNIYPQIEGGEIMFRRVLEEYPLVFVGVTDKAKSGNPSSLLSWAERRKGRLYYRSIVEYAEQGQDGGIYRFPHGDIEIAADWKSMQFVFRTDTDEVALPPLNAYTLRKRLLEITNPTSPDFSPVWAELIKSTYAQSPKVLTIELTQPHVRPEALVQVNHTPFDPNNPPKPDAYYIETPNKEAGDLYSPNPAYPILKERKLPQLVEVFYPNATEQTKALMRGDIDVIDRVFPADIRMLKKNPDIEVRAYTIPTVHVLLPNPRTDHMKSTIFRTALVYGINRPDILTNGLLANQSLSGFRVISGCVPYGITESDPIGYAYNPKRTPLVADPRIGLVQAVVADGQVRKLIAAINQNKGKDETPTPYVPLKDMKFKLVYPANEVARTACTSIQMDLKVIGVTVDLVEMKPGQVYPENDDFDLLYSEITMQEPLLDIRRVLAPEGLARTNNDAINQAIRFLDTARSWRDATPRLHELHDLCFNNSLVIPLWQMVEHYAYRKNVRGVGRKINTLYKNVVDWKITADYDGKE